MTARYASIRQLLLTTAGRPAPLVVGLALVLAASSIPLSGCGTNGQPETTAPTEPPPTETGGEHLGEGHGPVEMTITALDRSPDAGPVRVQVEVTPLVDVKGAAVEFMAGRVPVASFEPEGPAQLVGEPRIELGDIEAGETRRAEATVTFDGTGEAVVIGAFSADAGEAVGGEVNRAEWLYFLVGEERAFFSNRGFYLTRVDSVNYVYDQLIQKRNATEEDRQEALDALRTSRGQSMNMRGAPQPADPDGFATLTASGTAHYQDENGVDRPIRQAIVEVWDEDLVFDDLLATGTTDGTGAFSIDFEAQITEDVDIYIRVSTRNGDFFVLPDNGRGNAPDGEDQAFRLQSDTFDDTESDVMVTFTALNTSTVGQAFSVYDGLVYAFDYAENQTGQDLPRIPIEFDGTGGSFFSPTNQYLFIEGRDGFDWDVVHHEFGHYLADQFDLDNNPGGAHSPGQNLAATLGKDAGIRLAWGEGWPTYYGTALQVELGLGALGIPRVGDLLYEELNDNPGSPISYGIESQTAGLSPVSSRGEDNEVTVTRALWDLYDSAEDERDEVSLGALAVWNTLDAATPVSLSDAWNAFVNGLGVEDQTMYGALFADHAVAPDPTAPADSMIIPLSAPPPTFTWDPNGAGPGFRLNQFNVEFYSEDFSTLLFTSPQVMMPQYTPTAQELTDDIFGTERRVRWLVRGSNTAAPQTGVYVSPARLIESSGVDVAFVIDDTGSMGEEIAGVRDGLLAHLATYPNDSTTTFQLITFKDNVSPRPPTPDLATIQSQVAALFASGGGDCPEASVQAIQAAREQLRDNGRIFLATDADPHPGVDLPGTIDGLRADGIRVDVILSATCTGEGEFGPIAGTDVRGGYTSSNNPTAASARADEANRTGEESKPATTRRAYANSVQPLHATATPLFLGDDDFEAVLLPFAFPFGGGSYSTAYVGSNGYVTFGSGDTEYSESVGGLLVNTPRIAPLWDDLNPSLGGQITVEEVGGNAVITFDAVREYNSSNTVSFTITLRPDGTFAVTYGDLGTSDGLAAVHTGGGTNPGPTDLSTAPQPIDADPLGTVYEQFFSGVDLAGLTLEFAAVENGPPPPPPTFGAIAGFSRLALQTGGVFIFLPEVNGFDPLADQAFENAVFNLVQGGINQSLVLAQPRQGPQGSRLQVEVTGAGTSFQQGATDLLVSGTGVTVESITVLSPVRLLATLDIDAGAPLGFRDLEAVTNFGSETETALGTGVFLVTEPPSGPTILSIAPAVGAAGETLSVHVFGVNTSFDASSELQLGSGVTVLDQTAVSATELEATLQIASNAPVGFRDVLVVTGAEVASESVPGPFFVAAELPAVQATLVSASPSVGTRGTDVTLSVTGLNTGFADGVSVLSLSGTGTTALSTSVTSPTSLTAVVRIDAAAPLGARDVRVTTGAEVAVLLDGFVITNSSDCPTALVLSDFQAAPNAAEFVDLQNVGTETIDFATVDCVLGAFSATSYLGLPASGTLAPGEALRFGASGTDADIAFPDGTLLDGYSGLALLDREDLPNGTAIPTVQAEIVTSLVYLSGGTVYGFFHVDEANEQLYCELYDGALHPYGESLCTATAARGMDAAKSGAEALDFAAMMAAAAAEQARAEAASVPTVFALHAAYPNPLSRSATLGYDLPEAAEVRVVVYDVLGRTVAVLVDEAAEAGRYEASLDASGLASGSYVVRMTAEAPSRSFAQTQRFTVVR